VFEAQSSMQMIAHHIQTPATPPSRYSAYPVPGDLEEIILACLAKLPSDRPSSAAELADLLADCHTASPWTRADAKAWWATRLAPEVAVALED
jgi:eukaryotic-like serine/threonine-protein kinase